MYRLETVDLGTYRGDDYFMTGFAEPEPIDGEAYDPDVDAVAFGVSVARSTESGPNVEIVRMDTAHGHDPHIDRLYLPPDAGEAQKYDLGQGFTYEQMKRFLLAHWTEFVDAYVYYNE